jgi:hypothetical protein
MKPIIIMSRTEIFEIFTEEGNTDDISFIKNELKKKNKFSIITEDSYEVLYIYDKKIKAYLCNFINLN